MKYALAVCLLSLTALVGCGGRSTESVAVEETPAAVEIRSSLEYLAETGQVDSGVMSIEENIAKLQETDPAKATELSADLEKLKKSANNPAAVKSQAQAMLGKL